MKKFVCLLLSLLLIMMLISGCGSNKESSNQKDKPEDTSKDVPQQQNNQAEGPKTEPKVNEFGWEIPEETIEITFYAGQDNPDNAEEDAKLIGEYILEKFNVKLNKIVYDTDMTERLNLMLASNDYPEVITNLSPTNAATWVELGKAIELTPYIDEYAPNIKTKLGEIYNRLLDEEGRLYVMPKYWGFLPIPDASAHIRWDWWQEMGAPKFETPDEYFEVLKQMQANHPTNKDGEKTYALSSYGTWDYNTLAAIWGLKRGYKEDADHNLIHWVNTDEGLEMAKFINRFHREDLLDPDSFINTFDDWKAKFSSERMMGHIGAWWVTWNAGHEVWQKANPDWQDDMRFVQVKVKAPQAEQAYFSPKNTTGSYRTIITDKCTQPENVLKWWNFEISDMGTRLIGWGVPNLEESVWDYKDGEWSWRESAAQAIIDATWDFEISDKLGQGVMWMVAGQGLMEDGKSTVWFDQNFNDRAKWKKIMHENLQGTIYDFSAFLSINLPPDDPITVTNQQIKDILDTGWAEVVTASTEQECESKFLELRDKLNKAGLGDLEKYYTEHYKQNLENWK